MLIVLLLISHKNKIKGKECILKSSMFFSNLFYDKVKNKEH